MKQMKNKIILETERFYLREMDHGDIEALCEILQDEEVMYAYEHAFSDEEVRQWLEKQLTRYKNDGFGLWAVILKATGSMIGQCGLMLQDCNGRSVVEVGYLFAKNIGTTAMLPKRHRHARNMPSTCLELMRFIPLSGTTTSLQ